MASKGKLYISTTFDLYKFHELVVILIVIYEFHFQFSESEYINVIFQYLKSQLVSRNTLKTYILKILKIKKDAVKSLLKKAHGNMCTSIRIDFFFFDQTIRIDECCIALTTHLIDED